VPCAIESLRHSNLDQARASMAQTTDAPPLNERDDHSA
jgi:hypothetical protein